MNRGTDVALTGTADVCRTQRWDSVVYPNGDQFVGWAYNPTDASAAVDTTYSSMADQGWGSSLDNIIVKFTCVFTPLVTGVWSFGFASVDDLSGVRIRYGGTEDGKLIFFKTLGHSSGYWDVYMISGRAYHLEYRWYDLIAGGYCTPRFKYPGDATARVIQTTGGVLDMQKYDGYVDNTPLISAVL